MKDMFHVSSVLNRDSIQRHGLDALRMGAAKGIAGSPHPEAEGVFLSADEWDVDFFVQMNNTNGPVDVWLVADVDVDQLVDNGNGYFYLPGTIPAERVALAQRDLAGGGLRQE